MRSARDRWLGLVGLTLGVALIIVDATILNVAIPSIVRDLGLRLTGAQWANSIYALVLASLLVTFGRLADRHGRRLAFLAGVVVFLAGGKMAGLAPSPTKLLTARFVQGIGGAAMLPTSLSLVNATFRGSGTGDRLRRVGIGHRRGRRARSLLGGWAITAESWRWAFFINLPIGALAFVLVLRCVAESCEPAVTGRFDILGTVTFVIGMATLALWRSTVGVRLVVSDIDAVHRCGPRVAGPRGGERDPPRPPRCAWCCSPRSR